ncbi:MAG TPA: hypothetical protein VKU60_11570, partial [Chloroflexota bacterium]|nr:hypothetical protein [Chloroflexota bacterium]
PAEFEVLGLFPAYVSETPEQAKRELEPHWANMRRVTAEARGEPAPEPDYDRLVADGRAFFGDPEMCRRQLDRVSDIGLTRIALHGHVGGLPQERLLRSLTLFMNEVARKC